MNLPRALLLTVLLLSAPTGFAAADPMVFHVDPRGDDSADGSAERPLASLVAAQRLVRAAVAAGAEEVRVQIAAGDYVLDAPLAFTPADSGKSPERPVTYAAAGGAVRLSGGRRITGWRQEGERWIAKVEIGEGAPPFRDLWVNGRRAIRARAPNEGYFRIESAGPDNRTSFVVAAGDLLALAKPQFDGAHRRQAGEVAFLHDWSMSRVGIAAIDAASRTYRFDDPIGSGDFPFMAITGFEANPRYFVENAVELLDAPGEWFLDEDAVEVHYFPREGEMTAVELEVIAPRLEQLVVVRGEEGKPVVNLAFEGLTFSHSRFELPPGGYAGIQACMYERRGNGGAAVRETMIAAVEVDRAERRPFRSCTFEHLSACGLHLRRCGDCRVERSTVRDVGGDGLLVGSRDSSETPLARGNAIENCLVEHCGATFFGAVGVWVGMSADTVVAHNEIRELPYTGVSVGWQWDDGPSPCRGHEVRANHIHHVMQELSDGGGIYTLGRQPGTRLEGNHIHDVPVNAGRAESNGIFMDQGSTEFMVRENTIYNVARSPIRFHMAGKNVIARNRLVAAPGMPTFMYNACDPSVMVMEENEEISAASWQPPEGEAALKAAGPR